MKKIVLTTLVLLTPVTFSKPSMAKRAYHFGAGTASLALMGLGLAGGRSCLDLCYANITDEKPGLEHPNKAIVAYTCFFLAGAIGTWKLGSHMASSFKKAFGSSNLLEVTRDNYTSTVTESNKPFILAILPTIDALKTSVYTTLETIQGELPAYSFGTIELHEAADILGIKNPGIVFIKNGNLISNHEGIYNEVQLRSIISKSL